MSGFRIRSAVVTVAAASLALFGAATASAATSTTTGASSATSHAVVTPEVTARTAATISPNATYTVTNTSSCVALEKIELISGHDYMAEDPTVDAGGCWYGIWNLNTGTWEVETSSPSQSPWIYDGPGRSLQTCVWAPSNPVWICGPSN